MLEYVDDSKLVTKFSEAYQENNVKEIERLKKIIEYNAKLATFYLEEIRIAYFIEPNNEKFSFIDWLTWKKIKITKVTNEQNGEMLIVEYVEAH